MKWKQWWLVSGLAALGLLVGMPSMAAKKAEIDTGISQTLDQFYAKDARNKELVDQASGVLVFPRVTKVGVGVGGEHGEGALQVKGHTEGYYTIAGGSIGATLGAARRSLVVLFMNQEALSKFQQSKGWKIGVDANVAVVKIGAGGEYDTNTLKKSVVGFVFDEKGLLADISLEGAKISPVKVE